MNELSFYWLGKAEAKRRYRPLLSLLPYIGAIALVDVAILSFSLDTPVLFIALLGPLILSALYLSPPVHLALSLVFVLNAAILIARLPLSSAPSATALFIAGWLPCFFAGLALQRHQRLDLDSSSRLVRERNAHMQADRLWHRSEEQCRVLAEAIPDILFTLDLDGRIAFLNDVAASLGIKIPPAEDASLAAIFPALESSQRNLVDVALRSAMPFQIEFSHLLDNGFAWFDLRLFPVISPPGRVDYAFGVVRDITARKEIEQKLLHSESAFKNLAEHMRAGVYIFQNGFFRYVNPEFGRMFGASPEQIVGSLPLSSFVHPDDYALVDTSLAARVSGEEDQRRYEFRALAVDGRIFPVEVFSARYEWNGLPAALGLIIDVGTRKSLETDLHASLLEKEILLREVHHRVKNCLQVASSLVGRHAASIPDPAVIKVLQDCQARIRAMAIVHDKLSRSKYATDIEFRAYCLDLAHSLFRALDIDERRIALNIEGDECLIDTTAAGPCGLLVNELLTNALLHAFPDGRTGTITIGLRRSPDRTVEITVADDGIGLPYGFDIMTVEALGMQIVRDLTAQLDGALDVANQPGARFRLVFNDKAYSRRV